MYDIQNLFSLDTCNPQRSILGRGTRVWSGYMRVNFTHEKQPEGDITLSKFYICMSNVLVENKYFITYCIKVHYVVFSH